VIASPPVIVLISTDPRVSHRANEAMRIGLGVVAGENDVTFVLLGAGVHLLDEDTDEIFAKYDARVHVMVEESFNNLSGTDL